MDYFQQPDDTKEILNFSPHSLRYSVDGRNRSDILSLRVDVKNSQCHGREVSFLLTSTAVLSPASKCSALVSTQEKQNLYLHVLC